MIKNKIPEKVVIDFTYASNVDHIALQIKEAGNQVVSFYKDENKTEGSLYITDDFFKATEARQKDMAVLIYLHEQNRNHSFSGFQYFIEGFEDADEVYYERIYRREKKLPWIIGETDRLIIREMTIKDIDALYKLYEDKSVVAFMEDLAPNKEEEEAYITDYIDKMYGVFGFGMWLIELKNSAQIIGRIGFQNCEEADTVAFGFMVAPSFQRQGYAYEAGKAALQYMKEEFLELHIMAECYSDNKPAIALCKKLGVGYHLKDIK